MQEDKKSFKDFTNMYELSKTLRFELKPTNDAMRDLISGKTFDLDKKRQNLRPELLEMIDDLLREFINQVFNSEKLNISFQDYLDEINSNNEIKGTSKKFKYLAKNDLISNIVSLYKDSIEIEGIDGFIKLDDLLSEKVLSYLVQYYGLADDDNLNEEQTHKKEIINLFKGKFTLLQDYIKSRKNTIFAKTSKKGAIVHRIVDENFARFVRNKDEFEKTYELFNNGKLDFVEEKYKFTTDDEKFFKLDYYNKCFLESGIKIYNEEIRDLRSRLNNIIQEVKNYNRKIKDENKDKIDSNKRELITVPRTLQKLDKQILGLEDKIEIDFQIKDTNEFYEKLNELYIYNNSPNGINAINSSIFSFLNSYNDFDLDMIYLTKRAITTLSGKFFKDYVFLLKLLGKEQGDKLKLNEYYSLGNIRKLLDKFESNKENSELNSSDIFKDKYFEDSNLILDDGDYFKGFMRLLCFEFTLIFSAHDDSNIKFKKLLDKYKDRKIELVKENLIQEYSKISLDIYRMLSYFMPQKKTKDGFEFVFNSEKEDPNLYVDLHLYYDDNMIVRYFNLFRNFVSKKPYSIEKVNVNFNIPTLLNGWQESGGSMQYKAVILRRDGKYFLGILKTQTSRFNVEKHKDEFNENLKPGEYYEFMNYKQLKWGNNIVNNYNREFDSKYTDDIVDKGESLVVNRFKNILKKYIDNFPELQCIIDGDFDSVINLKDTLESFTLYKINFLKIKKEYVDNLSDFYLFQIYSKDFSKSRNSDSKIDQQTNYFKALFDEENIKILNDSKYNGDPIFKLDGQAKIFFREKTNNLPIYKKDGKKITYTDKRDGNKIKDVLQHRRYNTNKLMFHFPIKINFGNNIFSTKEAFNEYLNEYLNSNQDVKIIGLDRGEKHLLYLSLIDKNGKIEMSKTLNKVGEDDYKNKLEKIEIQRLNERKTWRDITTIKNLKDGYVSQIVKEIADLAIKENAIIVLENLNLGFKNSRKGIERQVYTKFENALIKKLNFYVDKNEKGFAYRKGIQLTPSFNNMKVSEIDKSNQIGILFYVNPSYTSQTCPNCNYIRNIYLFHKNLKTSAERLNNFKITHESGEFVFHKKEVLIKGKIDRKSKQPTDKIEKKLTFYSGVERLVKSRNSTERMWNTVEYNTTTKLQELFTDFEIDTSGDIVYQIIEKNSKNLYDRLFRIINIILSIRNSETEREVLSHKKDHEDYIPKDFLHCPVCKYHSETKENILPNGKLRNIDKLENADANGAYNIARKGAIILDRIRKDYKNLNLYISNEDWENFLLNK